MQACLEFANQFLDVVRPSGTWVTRPNPSIYRIIFQQAIIIEDLGEADDVFASLFLLAVVLCQSERSVKATRDRAWCDSLLHLWNTLRMLEVRERPG